MLAGSCHCRGSTFNSCKDASFGYSRHEFTSARKSQREAAVIGKRLNRLTKKSERSLGPTRAAYYYAVLPSPSSSSTDNN